MAREHVHLIGIGGTGMTALAGLLQASGCRVTGSDGPLYPPTSTILGGLGLEVYTGFDAAHLRPAPDLVVVGNAISRGNAEVEEMLDRDLRYTSMPRLLGERFLFDSHSIVVAGTHGKTTTSSMLAWILTHAGREPGFLIGGQPLNFERPFARGAGAVFVVEGDEYDTAFFDKGPKFMHYRPDTAIVGTVEFDHADIYRDLEEIKRAFARLVGLVPRRGLIVRDEDCAVTREVTSRALSRVAGFGLGAGQWRVERASEDTAARRFLVLLDERRVAEVELPVAGEHNLRNALAAIAAAHDVGVPAATAAAALAGFRGVSRRLEQRGEADGVLVLDDFAHHPTAIAATLGAVRRAYPGRRLWAVLEPRSWSLRRNVFQQRLAASFDDADEVIVAEVFRAPDVPEELRLDTDRLVAEIASRGRRARFIADPQSIVACLARDTAPGDVVVFMSNGGFGGVHANLLEALRGRSGEASRVAEGLHEAGADG